MKFGHAILSSELRGSLGGVVASSSRGGTGYFRVRARPGNPRSLGQTTVRSILTSIAAAWVSVLTSVQRAAWAAISSENSSGIDSYIKGNALVMLGGDTRVEDAPVSLARASDPITVTPVLDASAHTISITIPVDNTGRTAVFVSAPQKSSRLAQRFNFLYVTASARDATGATALAIPTQHPAYNAVAGDVVYVRTVNYGDEDADVAIGQEFRIVVVA